jgi:photosystem II stability/assembly factor-like uncharacterized protein
MIHNKIVFGAVILTALVWRLQAAGCAFGYEWQDIGAGNTDFTAIASGGSGSGTLYAGSKSALLRSLDKGLTWRPLLVLKGQGNRVYPIILDPSNRDTFFAGTGQGLYQSKNAGLNWKKIFRGKNQQENQICALALSGQAMYLGTAGGLFLSRDRGRNWQRACGKLAAGFIAAVVVCAQEPSIAWVASADGVFKTQDRGNTWECVFTAAAKTQEKDDDAQDGNPDDGEITGTAIHDICVDPENGRALYLATLHGVYQSLDAGLSWSAMTAYGLLDRQVKRIVVSAQSRVYAACRSGIFTYTGQRWEELSFGLSGQEIRDIDLAAGGIVYAACDTGLFTMQPALAQPAVEAFCRAVLPAARDVQEAAIEYAEVSNEKIRQWRKQAARKAWLPAVSVGMNRNTSDLWHWEGGSTTKVDDDALRKGRDSMEWDIRLGWDLGNIIWNDDQTSIDVRSKLMVELRDNILDEVTKLYFEYKRVSMELDNLHLEDKGKKAEKTLRLQELSASLDALTGGYFSSRLPSG